MKENAHIETAIQYIEENLTMPLTVQQIAATCFLSKRQLYRDFCAYTGHTVNQYIQKRRLSKALSLLQYSKIPLAHIAMECGYSSQQAMTASVKSGTDLTPKQYRNAAYSLYFPIQSGTELKSVTVSTFHLPEQLVLSFTKKNPTQIERWALYRFQQLLPSYEGTITGRNCYSPSKGYGYDLAIERSDEWERKLVEKSFPFAIQESYSALFAKTRVKQSISQLDSVWELFYNQWLRSSMFELIENHYFEEYVVASGDVTQIQLCMEIKPKRTIEEIRFKQYEERLFLIVEEQGAHAERFTSTKLLDFLSTYHPYFLAKQQSFYLRKQGETFTNGMELEHPVWLPEKYVTHQVEPSGIYAELTSVGYNNLEDFTHTLLSFLKENGFECDGVPFTIYDRSNKKGSARTQVRIKMAQMDNFSKVKADKIVHKKDPLRI